MAKYAKKSQKTVESAMRRKKKGTLRSGRSGKKVTSRKQAIAIGLSEAREKGAKVPAPKKKSARKRTAAKGRTTAAKGRTTARKKGAKKSTGRRTTAKKRAGSR